MLRSATNLDTERGVFKAAGDTKDRRKPSEAIEAPHGQAPSDKPALEQYWGKPAVRNLRGTMETSASFDARSAPSSYPTAKESSVFGILCFFCTESAHLVLAGYGRLSGLHATATLGRCTKVPGCM